METNVQSATSTFTTPDGLHVFYRRWEAAGSPKALMVLVHGFNSHSGYFQWVAEQLTESNFKTYALDLRGRGKSDGERYYIPDYNDLLADIDQLVNLAQEAHPGLPTFLLGHSAGGVLSSVYTLKHQNKLRGFICESFAFQVPAPDFVLAVLKGISHIAPHAHVLKLKNEDFSRDSSVVEAMNHDPLIAHEVQPTKTVQQLVLADERLKAEMPAINLPLLILHGTLDKATKPSGSQYFYDTAGSLDKSLKLYEGHYHDLLNDLDKEVVMADILHWLNSRV
ncbi:alpha/beta hydrolase [Adhaeribacter pallidiroseus]|uniref:Acylglycerol lipase n=1 Tax=Adhaeribacter pallidiroseus TaxID=2072847 RepID=A0A369QQI1_9BACT|nr:alpha/beta hydrolase [Adhaeribacter pallidiroseus]RDC65546.1 Acylglycerol lipase [Adhaeribacter pallidiroseus]